MWVRGVGRGAGRGDRERPVLAPAGSVPSRGTPPATGATRLDASLLVTRRQGGRERGTVWPAGHLTRGAGDTSREGPLTALSEPRSG